LAIEKHVNRLAKVRKQKEILRRAKRARNEKQERARVEVEQRERELQQALRATRGEKEELENREGIEEVNIEEDDEIKIVWDGTRRERRRKYG
jgi:hypothetical protein